MGEEIIRERWRLQREKGAKLIFPVLQHGQCHPMKYEVLTQLLLTPRSPHQKCPQWPDATSSTTTTKSQIHRANQPPSPLVLWRLKCVMEQPERYSSTAGIIPYHYSLSPVILVSVSTRTSQQYEMSRSLNKGLLNRYAVQKSPKIALRILRMTPYKT